VFGPERHAGSKGTATKRILSPDFNRISAAGRLKSKYPVLVTTSRLLSTGVDTRTAAEFGAQLSKR
jgi:hypothetical protein